MTPLSEVTDASDGVVALLLDDLAPPRLGTLLKGARKQGSRTRREVAGRTGTTPAELRRYERGDMPVPAHVIAALAECYGADLTSQLAARSPIDVDAKRIVVGTEVALLEGDGDVLQEYADLVQRVRDSQPGDPIALRAGDLVALSRALGHETDVIEARIVELLGCTRREARSLHAEILRRKLVVPVAGLVTGLAVVTGVGVAAAATGSSHAAPAHHATTHTAGATTHTGSPPPNTAAPTSVTPTTDAPAPSVAPAPPAPATAAPIDGSTTVEAAPTTERPSTTQAPDPEAPTVSPAVSPLPRPVITTDTTPMSIPAHETVTIIQP
ncbi:MAG: helix-turn-helix domain-containing protein [Acidimicrobiia bacterium]